LPVVGVLHAWQLAFMIVGLPGVIWAALLLATVPEPARRGEGAGGPRIPTLGGVLGFLARWRAAYLPLVLATGIKSMLSFGTTVWSPALFERRFGWGPGVPGLYIGIVALTASPVGLLIGGWLADRRTAQGHDDANMRVVLWASAGLLPFALLYPLMPTPASALAMLAGSLFFGGIGAGPGNTAIQVITPGRMRGTVSALYIAVFNVLGYGVGPLLVALITDGFFRDETMLPASMALAAVLLAPLGLLLSWMSLKPYARAVEAAREREG
ncbi:MAG: MFS transporter, partial [Sphingomonadales bacterium]